MFKRDKGKFIFLLEFFLMHDFVAIQHSEEMVTSVTWWSDALIFFKTTRPAALQYEAGEYARLAFPDRHTPTWHTYSFVSSLQSDMLEFFGVIVPKGNFSPQLQHLQQGDRILIEHESYGFMMPQMAEDMRQRLHQGRIKPCRRQTPGQFFYRKLLVIAGRIRR